MFREVSVVEAREVLRLWLRKHSLHEVARMLALDRKTVRRYVDAAVDAGLDQEGPEDQLGDELLGAVVGEVRTGRPAGRGESWQRLESERAFIAERIEKDLRLTKIHELRAARRGRPVPHAAPLRGRRARLRPHARDGASRRRRARQRGAGRLRAHGPGARPALRAPPRGPRPGLHARRQPIPLLLAHFVRNIEQGLGARARCYSGMLPCFFFGFTSRLPSQARSAEMSRGRVSCGSMTSSMYPRPAATYGFAYRST